MGCQGRTKLVLLVAGSLIGVSSACAQQAPPATAPQSSVPGTAATAPATSGGAAPAASPAMTPAAAGAAGSQAAPARRSGTLTEVTFADIKTMNSINLNDVPSGIVVDKLFEPLVWTDAETGEAIPWLAEAFEVSPDSTKFTFKIRRGVTWSDGQPFTAHDAKFTIESVLDPKVETPKKSLFRDIVGAQDKLDAKATDTSGLKVPDDYTLEITLSTPNCAFLISSMTFNIMPKHALEGQDINTTAFNSAPTVSVGPFLFKEWVKGSHVTLTRNDTYWGGPDGAAKGGAVVDQYVYKVVPDQNAVLNNIRTGEGDFGEVQPANLQTLATIPTAELQKWTGLRYTYVGFNLRKPVFQDKVIRKAMAASLDTQTFIENILLGEGEPLASHMPPTSWAYNKNVPLVKFDPESAKKMLDDAGYRVGLDGIRAKGDQKLKFTLYTNAGNKLREQAATVAQQQWKDIGIEVDLQFEEFSALLDRAQKTFDFDLIIIGWALDPEPNPEQVWHSKSIAVPGKPGSNFIAYSNPEVDRLIEQGKTVPGCAQDARKQAYDTFQEILAEDQPYIWLFLQRSLYGFQKRVEGEDPTPFRVRSQASWNAERMSLTP